MNKVQKSCVVLPDMNQKAAAILEKNPNSSILIAKKISCRQDAGMGFDTWKIFFGCKIAALNFKKLFTFQKGLGHYAQNPALA